MLPTVQRNKVIANTVQVLQEAEASRPTFDYKSGKYQRVISFDSLTRTLRRNDIGGKEKAAYVQAFRTLVTPSVVPTLRRQLGRTPTHDEIENAIRTSWVTVNAKSWSHLRTELRGFMTADRPGKAASALEAASKQISSRKVGKLQGDKDQSKIVNEALDVIWNYSGVAARGQVSRGDIARYFNGKGKKQPASVKNMVYSVFNYLRFAMEYPGMDVPRTAMCIDERGQAFDKLMALKPGGNTFKALQQAARYLD